MNPNSRIGLMGLYAALGALSLLSAGSPIAPIDRAPHCPPQPAPKAYRERIRYRKRLQWDGTKNERSLLDKARGAVAR